MVNIHAITSKDWELLLEALENYAETQEELSRDTEKDAPELSKMEYETSVACNQLLAKLRLPEIEEPHDGSGRVKKWSTVAGKWKSVFAYLDSDHAMQNIAALRKDNPLERYRLTPPGAKGYTTLGARLEDTAD